VDRCISLRKLVRMNTALRTNQQSEASRARHKLELQTSDHRPHSIAAAKYPVTEAPKPVIRRVNFLVFKEGHAGRSASAPCILVASASCIISGC
jgi:hypothetical protein